MTIKSLSLKSGPWIFHILLAEHENSIPSHLQYNLFYLNWSEFYFIFFILHERNILIQCSLWFVLNCNSFKWYYFRGVVHIFVFWKIVFSKDLRSFTHNFDLHITNCNIFVFFPRTIKNVIPKWIIIIFFIFNTINSSQQYPTIFLFVWQTITTNTNTILMYQQIIASEIKSWINFFLYFNKFKLLKANKIPKKVQ